MTAKISAAKIVGQALSLLRKEGRRIGVVGAMVALLSTAQQVLVVKLELANTRNDILSHLYVFVISIGSSIIFMPLITSAHRISLKRSGRQNRLGIPP